MPTPPPAPRSADARTNPAPPAPRADSAPARTQVGQTESPSRPGRARPAGGASARHPTPPRGSTQAAFARGVALVSITVVFFAGVLAALQKVGWTLADALVLSLAFTGVVGSAMTLSLVVTPARRTRDALAELSARVATVGRLDRLDAFDRLLLPAGHELHDLARALHAALTDAHKDRLEAARVRREMDMRVSEETRRATAELSKLSQTDALTGLPNRRFVDAELPRMFDEAVRTQRDLALLVIDLDHFKALNDSRGHEAGDEALRVLGSVLRGALRIGDRAARLGGDEFVALLPGVDEGRALSAAARLADLLSQHPFTRDLPDPKPTLSIGISLALQDGASDAEHLKRLADEALYAVKKAGRGHAKTRRQVEREQRSASRTARAA